jgi:hypothetical protein
MNEAKAEKRDKARNKRKNGQRVSGRSVFVIQAVQIKKAEKAKGKRNGK